jgi:hypothetical protein
MKRYKFFGVLIIVLASNLHCFAQVTYDWTGAVSSDWSNSGNWVATPSTAPGVPAASTDKIKISVNRTYSNGIVISTGTTVNCDSIVVGTKNVGGFFLTINGTINVKGIATQFNTTSTAGTRNTITFNGSGTVNCSGNINIGNSTAPAASLNGTVYSRLSAQCTLFNIIGNINLTSTANGASGVNYPEFMIDGGTVTLNGQIITLNRNSFSGTQASLTVAIRGVFQIDNNANTSTLILNNNNPISLPVAAGQVIDFNNNGTGSCTIIYNSSSGTQTVYTTNTPRVGQADYVYDNLSLSGASTKVIDGNYDTNPGLTIGGNFVTQSGAVDMATNNTYFQVEGSWTNSTTVTQGTGKFDINGVLINNGTLTLGTADMHVAGNYTNNSTINQGAGTIYFDGAAQTLIDNGNGSAFKKITFTGAGTKLLSSGNFSVASTGTLTMASNAILNANGKLTLMSDLSSTASVATIPTGCSVIGDVNVQRYLIGGNSKVSNAYTARGYRLLSSPVNISSKTDGTGNFSLRYINSTAITGGPGSGFTVFNPNPTLYLYREDVTPSGTGFNSGKHKGITSMNSDNTVVVSGSTGSLPLPVGNGFIFFFVGNTTNPNSKTVFPYASGPESTALVATGTLNQNNVTVNLWYTPAGATTTTANKLSYKSTLGTSAGFNMVGNPYACTIDLDKVIANNTASITNAVYELYNVNPGQNYVVYNKGGSSDPKASRYIVSGQGFMVQARGANYSLTFRESDKLPTQQLAAPALLMGKPVAEYAEAITGFYMKIEQDSLIDDYCGIYFGSNSSASFDNEDAKDLDGASSQVYLSSYSADGVRTAINHLPDYTRGAKVKLYVNAITDGLYKLKIEDIRNIDPLYDIWLKDKLLKDSLDIRRHIIYKFRVTRSDTSTYGANRFEIVIRRRPMPLYQLISFNAEKVTEGVKITWKTYNEGNFTGFQLEKIQPDAVENEYVTIYKIQSKGQNTYSYIDQFPVKGVNTYRLKQDHIDHVISYSTPVNVDMTNGPTNTLITLYPNPTVEMINVNLNVSDETITYKAKIYNTAGMLMLQKNMDGSSLSQNVGHFKPGSYIVELSKPDGTTVGLSKFIKN